MTVGQTCRFMSATGDSSLVSVVVPTYGRDRSHLRAAVASVAAQTYRPVELLVVDDSPGGVATTVAEVAGDLSVRILSDGSHESAGAARNTGLRAADGRFVAFLDDDDAWEPAKLARQVRAMGADRRVGLVVTGQRYVRGGETVGRRLPAVEGDVTEPLLRGRRLCPFSAAMVRVSVVDEAGAIDERLPLWEDIEWYLRLSRHCRVATVEAPLVRRRMDDHEQLTDDFDRLRDVAYPRLRDKHRSLAAAYGSACERRFLASLAGSVAEAALSAGNYAAARRFAARAVRADATYLRGYLFLAVAAGGRPAYRTARLGRQTLHRGRRTVRRMTGAAG
jgi:glycosyltransferase involved in cell wall biosynthesis